MKQLGTLMAAVLATGVMLVQSGQNVAQAQGLTCNDIEFKGEIVERFPNVADYCLSVHEVDGRKVAEFEGEVVRNRGGVMRARFQHPDGSWGPTTEFRPDMSTTVRIQGRNFRLRDMQRGQRLNFLVPESDFTIQVAEDDDLRTIPVTVLLVRANIVRDDGSDMLPGTASPVILYGLLGGLLVAFGAGIGCLRRFIHR